MYVIHILPIESSCINYSLAPLCWYFLLSFLLILALSRVPLPPSQNGENLCSNECLQNVQATAKFCSREQNPQIIRLARSLG